MPQRRRPGLGGQLARALLGLWVGLAGAAAAQGQEAPETEEPAPSALYGLDGMRLQRELVELAGGARRVVQRARHHLPDEPERALALTELALVVSPRDPAVLRTWHQTLVVLRERSAVVERFEGERGWLDRQIRSVEERLVHEGPR